jgi:hypothetical protein
MFELLKIFFLGKIILLSPAYIDISNSQPFLYKKQLSIVNQGANVEIDITRSNIKNILELRSISDQASEEKLDVFLKKCPIKIYGTQKNKKLFFGDPYISMVSIEDIRLQFSLVNSTDIQKIDELYIEPSCLLDNVKVYWKNYNE